TLSACAGCSIDDDAELLGAVNTVKAGGEGATGYNTDGKGFYADLRKSTAFNPQGQDIFVLGAGGAGRAISLYLAFLSGDTPKSINVFDVDEAKLFSLKAFFDASRDPGIFRPVKAGDISARMRGCGLVVNATPIGTKKEDPLPFSADNLREGMVLYDLVYHGETELVRRAREKGLVAVNALGMLIDQAALAFEIWTEMPIEETGRVMTDAVNAEIVKRKKQQGPCAG
ncbi:MAG: hypothetical protein KAS86_02990, partial [Candidatus Omnitrophica bacterium]|nr:hypothetical protein [Candidatus Omnitrophota bacterium]